MKKIFVLFFLLIMAMTFTACGGENSAPEKKDAAQKVENQPVQNVNDNKKSLVVYYSRAGENYQVGDIKKGNTKIVAEMIAQETGADMFEITPAKPYPEKYEECTEIAKKELSENARPEFIGNAENFEKYDTIFLGYPIWWSDLPMVVYTFLEKNDFSGKTIIPFCTSGGDYMTGKEQDIPKHAKGATMKDGIGIQGKLCQDNPAAVQEQVKKWLSDSGFSKK